MRRDLWFNILFYEKLRNLACLAGKAIFIAKK
jgi:hypothetical protein